MKKIIIASIAFILILSACRKKLDIEIPKGKEHIVVNGIITNDSLIKVNISKSQDILSNDNIESLNNAIVKLYDGENFIENLSYQQKGYYISSITSQIGKQYNILVSSDNLKPVKANMKLVEPTKIISIDTTISIENNNLDGGFSSKNYNIHFKIKLKDNINKKNYYFLSLTATTPEYNYDVYPPTLIGYYEGEMFFDSNDVVFNGKDGSFNIGNMYGKAFTDEMFNGKQYTININARYYINNYEKEINSTDCKIKVKLLSISEDLYRYITSYNLNQQSEYDPFAQPVQIYTNIENGLGLFTGYTTYIDSLNLDILNN